MLPRIIFKSAERFLDCLYFSLFFMYYLLKQTKKLKFQIDFCTQNNNGIIMIIVQDCK